MMKKVLFVCLMVLASTNVLAQDFSNIIKKIEALEEQTNIVKNSSKAQSFAKQNDFKLDEIDSILSKTKDFVVQLNTPGQNAVDKHLNEIKKRLDSYEKAIYSDDKRKIQIESKTFIDKIRELKEYVKNNYKEGEDIKETVEKSGTIDVGKKTEIEVTNNPVTVDIPNKYIIVVCCFMVINLILLICIVILLFKIRNVKLANKEGKTSSTAKENEQDQTTHTTGKSKRGDTTSGANDVNKGHTDSKTEERLGQIDAMLKGYDNSIVKLINSINEMSANISSLKESIEKNKENKQQFAIEDEKHKSISHNNDTSKRPRPQKVKLYGNLSQDGSMIYKASDTLREEYFYQINLNSTNDLEGELVIREGLSTEKMMNAISDRTKYLASPACIITSDKGSATRIEIVEKGTVRRQGYDWEIVNPVKVKIV